MDMSKCSPEEAADILLKAEEIKKDAPMFKAAQEVLKKKATTINSIADLKKLRDSGLTMKDLLTEDDKAALQNKIETDKKIEEMGFKVKDKVKMADDESVMEDEEDDMEEEEND